MLPLMRMGRGRAHQTAAPGARAAPRHVGRSALTDRPVGEGGIVGAERHHQVDILRALCLVEALGAGDHAWARPLVLGRFDLSSLPCVLARWRSSPSLGSEFGFSKTSP